jgi:hypothetical protein
MRTLLTKSYALFILLAPYATAQMVEGNIVDAATGAGIPRVAVTLMPASESASDDEPYNTVSDPLGHFAFSAIKPGTYIFTWFSQAYLRTESTPFPQIHVTAGGDPLSASVQVRGVYCVRDLLRSRAERVETNSAPAIARVPSAAVDDANVRPRRPTRIHRRLLCARLKLWSGAALERVHSSRTLLSEDGCSESYPSKYAGMRCREEIETSVPKPVRRNGCLPTAAALV